MTDKPTILLIPGLNNSGQSHWQTHWENSIEGAQRVQLGNWTAPHKNSWITKLGVAIRQAEKPVIIVAHSLGCHALAWWAASEPDAAKSGVAGAMLVAPPNVDSHPIDDRLKSFSPAPRFVLPFPTLVVGSENDPYCSFDHSLKLARRWGARFINAGRFGHINADSGIGTWPYGQYLLGDLLRQQHINGDPSHVPGRTIERHLPIRGESQFEEGIHIR